MDNFEGLKEALKKLYGAFILNAIRTTSLVIVWNWFAYNFNFAPMPWYIAFFVFPVLDEIGHVFDKNKA